MPITYRDYGPWSISNTYVDPNPSQGGPAESDFKVARLTNNQIELNLSYMGMSIGLNYLGQFDLSGLTVPVKNLEDLSIAQSQGAFSGTAQSILLTFDGKNGGLLTASPAISTTDMGVLLDSMDLAAMRRILAGNDSYITSSTAEDSNSYYLYGGNDTFFHNHPLLQYNDVFNGGNGIDTAVMLGRASNFTVSASKNVWDTLKQVGNLPGFVVTDTTKQINTLQVTEVERLKFSDSSIALDVGPSQNAGSLYMLYKAAFNRAPDAEGMGYWLSQVDGGRNIVTDIAAGFVKAPEFVAKYGTNPTNAFYVDQLYLNVLGRPGESGGVAYWNAELNAGNRSKAEVLVQFATLPEGAALVADLIANGISYIEFVG